jgi:lipopolysaccharide transport system ATP-binding protein
MNENEILVKVEGLSKKFCKDLRTGLWYGVQDLFTTLLGNNNERKLRPKEFWALKDISFELRRGECLGLIGHNGAGKSTLLKILNGLIKPDAGRVMIKGRVGALIELGAGFNPILTGRENIYNNGAILGFTRQEINEKLDEIIDFAEIREFIDMPVQHYSSGMNVRLGFAIAAQMQPDVLLIDEVLAVGDLGFTLKCFKTIDTILPNTAIIFVSHSMPMVSRTCNNILLMDKGNSIYQGQNISLGIDYYYQQFGSNSENVIFDEGLIKLIRSEIISKEGQSKLPLINWNEKLSIRFKFFVSDNVKIVPLFRILIYDKEQRPVAIFAPNYNSALEIKGNYLTFDVTHKKIQLSKGIYSINLTVFKADSNTPILRMNNINSFQIRHKEDHFQPLLLESFYNNINI